MEKKILEDRIERFFNAELSVEEERELYHYLRENDVPAELRRDKETIIALCGDYGEVVMPEGATARLEAMIDELADMQERVVTDDARVAKTGHKILTIPRIALGGAVAAVMAVAAYILFLSDGQLVAPSGEGNVQVFAVTDADEEDTFDNPEDAMLCFKAACDDVLLAINTANNSSREIGNTLKESLIHNNGINNRKQ